MFRDIREEESKRKGGWGRRCHCKPEDPLKYEPMYCTIGWVDVIDGEMVGRCRESSYYILCLVHYLHKITLIVIPFTTVSIAFIYKVLEIYMCIYRRRTTHRPSHCTAQFS